MKKTEINFNNDNLKNKYCVSIEDKFIFHISDSSPLFFISTAYEKYKREFHSGRL